LIYQVKRRLQRTELPIALCFLLPSMVLFAMFYFYPMVDAIKLSFYEWNNPNAEPIFIGLENYTKLLTTDRFWNSLRVTFTYAFVVTTFSILLGLFISVFLNHRWLVLKHFWRGLYFLPTVTPTVASAMVWILLLDSSIPCYAVLVSKVPIGYRVRIGLCLL
jgi:multiple sugar transport system permease protein